MFTVCSLAWRTRGFYTWNRLIYDWKLADAMRWISLAAGMLFMGLGALGAFLPVLPTTPFLLLASFFFARSSPRFDAWFRGTKLYHRYLENFLAHRSMTLRGKLCILAVSFAAMGVSFWKISVWWVRAILAALALFELYYFRFRIRTVKAADR